MNTLFLSDADYPLHTQDTNPRLNSIPSAYRARHLIPALHTGLYSYSNGWLTSHILTFGFLQHLPDIIRRHLSAQYNFTYDSICHQDFILFSLNFQTRQTHHIQHFATHSNINHHAL